MLLASLHTKEADRWLHAEALRVSPDFSGIGAYIAATQLWDRADGNLLAPGFEQEDAMRRDRAQWTLQKRSEPPFPRYEPYWGPVTQMPVCVRRKPSPGPAIRIPRPRWSGWCRGYSQPRPVRMVPQQAHRTGPPPLLTAPAFANAEFTTL